MTQPSRTIAPARRAPALLFGAVTAAKAVAVAVTVAAAVAAALALGAPPRAAAAPASGEETRAIWVVRHALTTPGRVDQIVSIANAINVNTLLVQVRGRGDAYYKSDLAPPAEDMGGAPEGFDPLDQIIRRAHATGLEVHAWINVYLVWSAGALPQSQLHIVNAHPDWISVRADGRRLVDMVPQEFQEEKVEGMYLAPANPDVKRYLRDVVHEIVTRYPVDGIHLDYIRYPDPMVGYDQETRTEFEREFGIDPLQIDAPDSTTLALIGADRLGDLRARWIEWKREQITDLVRAIRHDLDLAGRPIKLTAAVISDQNAALNRYLQDWPTWLHEGLIDAAVPMTYSPSTPIVERQLRDALAIPTSRQVWAGVAVYNEGARDAADKIRIARKLGVDGISIFSYDTFVGGGGYQRAIKSWAFRDPTLVTPMPWRK